MNRTELKSFKLNLESFLLIMNNIRPGVETGGKDTCIAREGRGRPAGATVHRYGQSCQQPFHHQPQVWASLGRVRDQALTGL